MMKKFIFLFFVVCIGSSIITIFYWRSSIYEPEVKDLIFGFFLIPAVITVIIYLFFKLIKQIFNKKRVNDLKNDNVNIIGESQAENEIKITQLNFYNSKSICMLGGINNIFEMLKKDSSPDFDMSLLNIKSSPISSYRIKKQIFGNANDINEFEYRVCTLIKFIMEENANTFNIIAKQLIKTSLFYTDQPLSKYKVHPKWQNFDFSPDEEPKSMVLEQPQNRIDKLNFNIILSKYYYEQFNKRKMNKILVEYLKQFEVLIDHIQINYHFLDAQDCYESWLLLLENISKQEYEISFIIAVDSEIDENLILKKTVNNQKYIPSEFISSCFISSQLLPDLEKNKKVTIIKNADKMKESLEFLEKENLEQYQKDQPFLILLDEFLTHSQHIKFDEIVRDTSIGTHHILSIPNYLGDTQNLADIWKFMLGLQLPKEITSMVISMEKNKHQIFIESENVIAEELHQPT